MWRWVGVLVLMSACGGDDEGGSKASSSSGGQVGSESGSPNTSSGSSSAATNSGTAGSTSTTANPTSADTTMSGSESTSDDPPVEGSGSIEFFGNGGLYGDRVLIELDDPATVEPGPPVDVGNEDFTIELWIRPDPKRNANPAIGCGSTNDWVTSNIIVDRDRHSQPPSFGIGIAGGTLIWAVQGEGGDPWSMCGSVDVLDGNWHHVAVQRRRSDGYLWLFVDGQLDADEDGPDGDISYPDDGVPMDVCPGGVCDYSDPFLAIGAEKHGYEEISFTGLVDELRISTTLRYGAEGYELPGGPFSPDAETVGLYHFDEGSGVVAEDATRNGSDGALVSGGRPEGPQWSAEHPWR